MIFMSAWDEMNKISTLRLYLFVISPKKPGKFNLLSTQATQKVIKS